MEVIWFSLLFHILGSVFALPKSEPETATAEGDPNPEPQWESGSGNQGWNNGDSGFNSGGGNGWDGGNSGFNPGGEGGWNSGGGGWDGGDSGFNPGGGGGWNGGDSGFNPGGGGGWDGGDSGFNPGGGGGGNSGFNPGGNGYITPVYNTDQKLGQNNNPGAPVFLPGDLSQGFFPGTPGGGCASEQCCGMADQNCCLGGKQCYTYYQQECKRVDRPRCQIESQEFCKQKVIPMCRVIRTPKQTTVPVEKCTTRAKRKCFTYEREICNTFPESYMHNVTWTNDRLEETNHTTLEDCKEVDVCKMVPEVKTTTRVQNKQVCNETRTEQKQQCTMDYEQGQDQVIQKMQVKIDYQDRCYNVPRQICESNPCTAQGCVNGGSVCSTNDYTYQQRCATMVCGKSQNCPPQQRKFCQEGVKEALCYGPSTSCESPAQQCCRTVQQRVCQKVPVRVPVPVNITIPGQMTPKRNCKTVDIEVPVCKNYPTTISVNTTVERCETEKKKQCVTFEFPVFTIVKNERSEQVDLRVKKCKKTSIQQEYCHVFPNAEVQCRQTRESRRYILNKVVCDRQRETQICRSLPWSRCVAGSDQECNMVPRQRCVDTCSNSPECTKCDRLRQQGALQGGCPTQTSQNLAPQQPLAPAPPASSTCGNFYPQDTVAGFNPQLSAPASNKIYPPAKMTSETFIPATNLPYSGGFNSGDLPEIGDRTV